MAQDDFIDYDVDNDHLTEVSNLAQLNAMRWDGFGNGAPTSADQAAYLEAFPGGNVVTFPKMGCPMTCKGYELTADMDFDTNGNLTADAGDEYWKDGAGWAPIFGQTSGSSFEAIFEGNGHVISNLFINRPTGRNGLFGHIFNGVTVRNVGLVNVDVTGGGNDTGALVGFAQDPSTTYTPKATPSYATGKVAGTSQVGGMPRAATAPASLRATDSPSR